MLRKQAQNISVFDSLFSQNKGDYRKEVNERQPEIKQDKVVERDRSWATNKIAQNNYGDTIARNGNSIRSSRCASAGGITNDGGSGKQIGSASANSIWNTNALDSVANTLSNKEATQIEKASANKVRMMKQAEYKQSISPKLGDETPVLEKGASISSATAKSAGKGWVPVNQISLFDNNDNFDRLTALENRVNPKVEATHKKVADVHSAKTVKSSKDATNNLVESLMDNNKNTDYKSVHSDAVDRLFNIINKK
jgi:hypothetical protein